MSKREVPESFEQDTLPHDIPPHSGPLASGGHNYDNSMTGNLDAGRRVTTTPETPTKGSLGTGFWIGLIVFFVVLAAIIVVQMPDRQSPEPIPLVEPIE